MKGKGTTVEGLVRHDLSHSEPASNLVFNEEVKSLRKSGRNIYHFAFGLSPFPIPKCLVKAVQEFAHANEYLPMVGIPELREELVKFHAKYDQIKLNIDNFIVGPGSKELIYLVMTTFSGDILLPAPAWTTYAPQIRLAGKTPIVIQTDRELGWKLTPDILEEAAVRSSSTWKLLILTNPGNPSGTCYTNEQLAALSVVCRRRSILVLSDEIYARLTFSREHATMVKYFPEGTILTSGFSKWASAGGWRLGYAHFPSELRPLMAAVKSGASHTYSCAPAPMQYGVAKAFKENADELDQYMDNCTRILKAIGDYCHRELTSVGVTGTKSQAGYYYMPDFEVVRKGYSCAPAPMQYGVAKAFKENADELDQYMDNCTRILKAIGDYCHRELTSVGVTGTKSQAGYYYMPDFEVVRKGMKTRNMTSGDHMSKALLEEADVAVMPAHAFLRPAEELTTRFCFVCFDGAEALKVLETSGNKNTKLDNNFLRRYCLPIVEGIESLKKWVIKHS